jgi:hypothetical protein
LFYHPSRNIRTSVHGDDFTNLGSESQLLWLKERFLERYEIKVSGIMGPGVNDVTSARVLNRLITWHSDHIAYEADPRHVEIIVQELGLQGAKPVSAPGGRDNKDVADESTPLSPQKTFQYRSLVMRAQYLSLDRRDIQFSSKELARKMQAPSERDWQALKKLGRFLLGRPRLVWQTRVQFGSSLNSRTPMTLDAQSHANPRAVATCSMDHICSKAIAALSRLWHSAVVSQSSTPQSKQLPQPWAQRQWQRTWGWS